MPSTIRAARPTALPAALALMLPVLLSCDGGPAEVVTACTAEVQARVELDVSPARITWDPPCGVAQIRVVSQPHLLVAWHIHSTTAQLRPPILYGVVPAGAVEDVPPQGATRPPANTSLSLWSQEGMRVAICQVLESDVVCQ